MSRLDRKLDKKIQELFVSGDIVKKIQSFEGAKSDIDWESLLLATITSSSSTVPGITNQYKSYPSQVSQTYLKYNGRVDFGCQPVRAIVDLRAAFILGEGISVSCEEPATRDWIDSFLKKNRLHGLKMLRAAQDGEMAGKAFFVLREGDGETPMPRVFRYSDYSPANMKVLHTYTDSSLGAVLMKKESDADIYKPVPISGTLIYIRTGGDASNSYDTTTKVGIVLTDCENYDRSLKDMRRLNYVSARITPTWKTDSDKETKLVVNDIKNSRWKSGQAYVGTAEFEYKTPESGAHENLLSELAVSIKTIASVTGIPVHWLGWVDLMSNRSTAETLYEAIKVQTDMERTTWAEAWYDIIVKAQEMYIDTGGTDISVINTDFEVKIPIIDMNGFLDRVRALSIAYNDEVISTSTYQNFLPQVDPLTEADKIAKEKEQQEEEFKKDPKENDDGTE